MADDEGQPKAKRQSRQEIENLKHQFMDRARQFMDDTAIGEGRKVIQKLINKVQGIEELPEEGEEEEWDGELLPDGAETRYAEHPQDNDADFEDEEWDEPDEDQGLDWNRPEYIRAGYARPGSKVERAKSLEEAQEESFSLKMGNLSGLLSRFGSEDASPESERPQGAGHRLEMNKPLFQSQMQSLYAQMSQQSGTETDPRLWLHPEVLTLLRAGNSPQKILLFAMAALFAGTPENYLTESDQEWIRELLTRAGFLLEPKEIQRVVEQTFVFPERVHRLYESLLNEPIVIQAQHIEQYRENLAKLYIYEVANRYQAEPGTVIRTLATHWQDAASQLQQALAAVTPIQEQYVRFQDRKITSGTILQKLRQAQQKVLEHYQHMQLIAREIEGLKQVTRLIEEEDALQRLEQFRTEFVLSEAECVGSQSISLYDLREQFIKAQIQAMHQTESSPPEPEVLELSPVEQKHAIARAKEGELKSLKLIENYKAWRMFQAASQPAQAGAAAQRPATGKASASVKARMAHNTPEAPPLKDSEQPPDSEQPV